MIAWWREIAIAAALAFAGLQTVRLSSEQSEHFRTKAAHAVQMQRLADASTAAAVAAQRAQQTYQQAISAIDTQRTQELSHALADNDFLRAAVRDGTRRLRIAAVCPARPAGPSDLPSTPPAASVDAQAAHLTAEAERAVLDLRAALITEQAQLLALQDYARACAAPKAPDAP